MEKTFYNKWEEIENEDLKPEERSPSIPDDTKNKPYIQWTRGYLLNDVAFIGDDVEIKTSIGRVLEGRLNSLHQGHFYSYGETVQELIDIGVELRGEIKR